MRRRGAGGKIDGAVAYSVGRMWHAEASRRVEKLKGSRWPSTKWADDPVGFVEGELGEEVLDHQAAAMRDLAAGKRVAIKSGTKTGKTKLIVWLALWFYCSRVKGRVFFTAMTNDQIDRTIWKELKDTVREAGIRTGFEIEEIGAKASYGVKSEDGREIMGFTAQNLVALQGLSGANMLFISDEASGLSDIMGATIQGNLAGGGLRIVTGNPNFTTGYFFDIFHRNKDDWSIHTFNSEEIARSFATMGKVVPGIATLAGIAELERAYTRGGEQYSIRVLGQFHMGETGRIYTLTAIIASQERHGLLADNLGTLAIGCDPAGPGAGGDETSICIVRGAKQLGLFTFRSLTEDGIIAQLRGFLKQYRLPGETPRIMLDSEGPIGHAIYGKLWGIGEALRVNRPDEAYDLYGLKASADARREPHLYDRLRDEMHANLAEWLKTGGILRDLNLEGELQFPSFFSVNKGGRNLLKATPKEEIREKLGRSPDRFDSLALATWDPGHRVYVPPQPELRESSLPEKPEAIDAFDGIYDGGDGGFDPYRGV